MGALAVQGKEHMNNRNSFDQNLHVQDNGATADVVVLTLTHVKIKSVVIGSS